MHIIVNSTLRIFKIYLYVHTYVTLRLSDRQIREHLSVYVNVYLTQHCMQIENPHRFDPIRSDPTRNKTVLKAERTLQQYDQYNNNNSQRLTDEVLSVK